MLSFYRKYWKTAFDIALLVLTVYLIMYAFSFVYHVAKPIFLSFVIFAIVEPFARFLHRRKLKKSVAAAIAMVAFILVALFVLTAASAIIVKQTNNLLTHLDAYTSMFQQQLIGRTLQLRSQIHQLPPNIASKLQEYLPAVSNKGAQVLQWFFHSLVRGVSSFSSFMANFFVGVVLAYFLSVEIDTWRRFARNRTPRTFKTAFTFLREHVLRGIGGYIKAQLKLISITFVIVFAGLLILQTGNAFTIALLCALFDLLPLVGVPVVFVPWAIYLLIVGHVQLGVLLLILMLVVIVVRQLMEPKITGDTLGVSAFTMLSFMIVSLSIFGVAGVILSPVLIILIKALLDQGYLQRWIRLPAEEFDAPDEGAGATGDADAEGLAGTAEE